MLEEMELDLKEAKDSKSWKRDEKYPRNGKQVVQRPGAQRQNVVNKKQEVDPCAWIIKFVEYKIGKAGKGQVAKNFKKGIT